MGIISANIMLSAVCESSFCCCCSCKVFRFVSYENVAPYVDVEAFTMFWHRCYTTCVDLTAGLMESRSLFCLASALTHLLLFVWTRLLNWFIVYSVYLFVCWSQCCFYTLLLGYTICIEKIRDVGFVNLKWLIKYSLNIKTFK